MMCGFFQQTEVIFGQIEGDMGCVVVSKALKTFPSRSFRVGGWAYLCLSQCSEEDCGTAPFQAQSHLYLVGW